MRTTPSSTVETDGSTPGEVVIVPTPRMKMVRSLFDAPLRNSTDGTDRLIASILLSWRLARDSPPTAVIAIGTLRTLSVRNRAVTTISPLSVAAAASGAGEDGAGWAG